MGSKIGIERRHWRQFVTFAHRKRRIGVALDVAPGGRVHGLFSLATERAKGRRNKLRMSTTRPNLVSDRTLPEHQVRSGCRDSEPDQSQRNEKRLFYGARLS